MNIFATSSCPVQSARSLDDKRVIKMIAESCQILVTALHSKGVKDLPIKPTHDKHPVCVWARTSKQNYTWLLRHTIALMREKRLRYPENKPHKYESMLGFLSSHKNYLPDFVQTPFKNCAANKDLGISYKHVDNVHKAYQLYLTDRWDTDKRAPTWYRQEK